MKKTTLAIVCLLGCTALSLSAQEANQHIPYKECGIDFSDYFEDIVGVTKPDGAEPMEVPI